MFRVALTGGIASGKSVVANEFAALGVPVLDTDQIARDIVEPGTPALARIVAEFGADMLDASGHMDRRKMRDRVFADSSERKKLEAITHPAIREELARRSALANGPYQIHAIPLFAEGGGKGDYHRILVVDCPEDLQVQRLVARDAMNETQARKIMAVQASRDQRRKLATDIIANDGTIDTLREQVRLLHERYCVLANAQHAR